MVNTHAYYRKNADQLEMYQRLIQYWSIMFDRREQVRVLDNMNFNLSVYPQPLHPAEVIQLHPIEPGYMSPDGSTELNRFVRELEHARLLRADPQRQTAVRQLVEAAGVGCGNGCSNVMNGVLNAILKLHRHRADLCGGNPEIILTLPNYTVYAAQLSNLAAAITPRIIYAHRETNFLPTFEQFEAAVTDRTVAFILTYPNNPAQSTYEGRFADHLLRMVKFCQEREIFLIVDNIYQDLVFPIVRPFTEIFSLTNSLEYVIKIYGSSKDTPFFSGFRTGYWFGDPRIEDAYRYYISSSENSLNTHALNMFALNMYFKMLSLHGTEPDLESMDFFCHGVFGWSQTVDRHALLDAFQRLNLYQNYQQRIARSNQIQSTALQQVIGAVAQLQSFSDYVNQSIGNVFLIKVNSEYFPGHDHDFFWFLLCKAQYGVLPGNVFGMPIIPGEVWFRITLVHDTADNVIEHLSYIDDILRRQ